MNKLYRIPEDLKEAVQGFVDTRINKVNSNLSHFEKEMSVLNGAFALNGELKAIGVYWPVPDTDGSPQDVRNLREFIMQIIKE